MPEVYIVKNQQGLYLDKHKQWADGSIPQQLYRTAHHDEAVNSVFEATSKNVEQRAEAVLVEATEKGWPIVEVAELPAEMRALLDAELEQAKPGDEAQGSEDYKVVTEDGEAKEVEQV